MIVKIFNYEYSKKEFSLIEKFDIKPQEKTGGAEVNHPVIPFSLDNQPKKIILN